MQTLEAMLRASTWAAALSADELDQVVREAFERHVGVGGSYLCFTTSARHTRRRRTSAALGAFILRVIARLPRLTLA